MGSNFRRRNQQYAIAVESVAGTDETPDAAADAIQLEPTDITPQFETETTNEVTGGLDAPKPIPAGGYASASIATYMRGNAAPGSTAPKLGRILRAGACSETLTAAAIADTAQAGAAGTITLHAGASAVNDAYKGMVITTTGGTGPGQTRVIKGYVGSTKVASVYPNWAVNPDATTTFSIAANALYRPISVGLEAVSFYQWEHNNVAASDSILTKLVGAMANPTIEINVRKAARITGNMRGLFPGVPTDVSKPSAPSADTTQPPLFMGADAYLGGTAVKFNRFTLGFGLNIDQFDNPAATFGYDEAEATERLAAGEITPNRVNMATRNAISDFIAGSTKEIWLRWGSTVGSRFSLYVGAAQYREPPQKQDVRAFTAERLNYQATGADDAFRLCIY
jgi:hypothetical protein